MRQPKYLTEKGMVGFVAPSFGCNIEPYRSGFDAAQKRFQEMGHRCKIGPNCYEGSGIGISNTPEKCGEEINSFFADSEVEALLSCGGGELMCEILDYVNFEQIAALEPKWYMGYSDNTNLTFLLTTLCDVMSVYGPCAPAFGMRQWHPSIQDAYDLLRGNKSYVRGYLLWEKESLKDEEHPLEPYHTTEPRILHCYPAGEAYSITGRLIGGCLDCLGNLVGTKFDQVSAFVERYQEDGLVWYMEACDLNLMSIRRTLWQLSHAGWFRYVRGFLVGRPLCFGTQEFGLDQYRAVTDILGAYQVPIIMDVDIGHLPPMMPLINGAMTEITVQKNDIRIQYRLQNDWEA